MNPTVNLLKSPQTPVSSGDEQKITELQHIVEESIDERAKQQILQILDKISLLKPHERFLLYLRLPGSSAKTDPLKQSQNPLGTRSEINHTINWVRTHLEHDPNVSIPKQDVYDDYELYCNQVNIKPLSTADFGKVMKQIFPDIRPRRLGTRGNSRYCYAALRKTTKLAPPQLPDMLKLNQTGGPRPNNNSSNIPPTMDDDSSSHIVVKNWAEGLFNIKFENFKELANYIMTNANSKTIDSNNMRIMLPKDLRTARKTNDSNLMKKKKKKKQKKSSIGAATSIEKSSSNAAATLENHSMLPAGLVETTISTNLNILDSAIIPSHESVTKLEPITSHQSYSPSLKMHNKPYDNDIDQSDKQQHPTVVCKKVKQAQQTKTMLHQSVPILSDTIKLESMIESPTTATTNAAASTEPHLSLMGPPEIKSDLIRSQFFDLESSDFKPSKRICRFTRREVNSPMLKTEDATAATVDIAADININIPRERVISICNLDKDALDDYLIDENNSQEQEAELLKYFHNDVDNSNSCDQLIASSTDTNKIQGEVSTYAGASSYSFNNYPKNRPFPIKEFDELSELRQCLQQSLPLSSDGKYTSQMPKIEFGSTGRDDRRKYATTLMPSYNNTSRETIRKMSSNPNNTKSIPQSPNTRRKNFSFVPISARPQSPARRGISFQNNDINTRRSSNNTRSAIHYCQPQYNLQRFASVPSSGCGGGSGGDTTGSYSSRLKEDISFSAPSSPLLPLRTMHSMASKYNNNNSSSQTNYAIQQQECLESRSQSVPLHRHSPAFRNLAKYDTYSVSHSISQTPVPPDFSDFTDDQLLNTILAGPPNIKIENTATSAEMPIMSNHQYSVDFSGIPFGTQQDNDQYGQQQFYSSSRSVPSTPQPILNFNPRKIANFDMSKSVPTTPINMAPHAASSFRYSPEQSRDFLINGNSVDPCLTSSIYSPSNQVVAMDAEKAKHQQHQHQHQQQQQQRYTDDIEELTTFGDAADPIVGSDLLNNL